MSAAKERSRRQIAGAALRAAVGFAVVLTLAACEREMRLPGERFDTRIPLAAAGAGGPNSLDPADEVRPISLAAPVRVGDWTQRGYNTRNVIPHLALSASPQQVWVADIGAGNSRRQRITADPVAADGRVFTIDAQSGVSAVALNSGAILWQQNLTPDFDRGGGVSGGGLAVSDGRLFATTGYGELIAMDAATGNVLWRQRLGAGLGTPTVSGGVIYIVSDTSEAWAISADDGRLRWQQPTAEAPSVLAGGAAPAISDRFALLPYPTGEIVAVMPQTGVRIWGSFVAGGRLGAAYSSLNDITSDPVVSGGRIYAGNQSGNVVAMSARNGERIWTARDGAYSPVVLGGGSLFFVSDRNELIRLDADTGAQVWGTELPLYIARRENRRRAVFTHYGPLLAGGRLVLASGDGLIRTFSPESGALVGSLELRGGAAAHPIVVNDTLLVVSGDGRLHAYR